MPEQPSACEALPPHPGDLGGLEGRTQSIRDLRYSLVAVSEKIHRALLMCARYTLIKKVYLNIVHREYMRDEEGLIPGKKKRIKTEMPYT